MKFIMSLLAVIALSFVTSAFAQEEEPSATPAENPAENSSATVEEKPSTTISAEPSSQKKEEPAAQKKEESAAPKKKEAVATTAAAPASAKKMSAEASLKDMENRFAMALGKHDAASIDPMVADDYVGVTSKGKTENRRSMMSQIKGDKDTYTSNKNEKLDVHMFGKDVGVVVGTYREKGTGKDGKAFDRGYRYTDTWMNRGGKWQLIASQVMLMAGK